MSHTAHALLVGGGKSFSTASTQQSIDEIEASGELARKTSCKRTMSAVFDLDFSWKAKARWAKIKGRAKQEQNGKVRTHR
jgi:hypothetical protein